MAKDLTPDAWLVGSSENGTDMTIPIAAVTGLTAAEFDTATGQINVFMYKLLDRIYTVQQGLADADKPDTMLITKTQTTTGFDFRVRFIGTVTTFTLDADV